MPIGYVRRAAQQRLRMTRRRSAGDASIRPSILWQHEVASILACAIAAPVELNDLFVPVGGTSYRVAWIAPRNTSTILPISACVEMNGGAMAMMSPVKR